MNEFLWIIMLVVNFVCILAFYRLFGRIGLYVWIPISAIIANIIVLKTIVLFGLEATLGNIVYASSFLVTDILSENYGKAYAKKAVYIGFFSLLVLTVLMKLSIHFVPSSNDFAQENIKAIFDFMPRLTIASFSAYFISQQHDVWAYNFWKKKFPENKYIWIRNNLSTMVSQLIDSVIFTFAAFLFVFDMSVLLEILLTTYLFKWIVALCDTPFIYIAKMWKEKKLIPAV